MYRNHFNGTGVLGAEPNIKVGKNGKKYAFLSVALFLKNGKAGERQNNTSWINVSVYDKSAEYIEQYAGKGDTLGIEGSLQPNNYKNKNGIEIKSWKIDATDVVILKKSDKYIQPGVKTVDNPNATMNFEGFDVGVQKNDVLAEEGLVEDSSLDISPDDLPF